MNCQAVISKEDPPALDVAGVLVLVQEVFVISVNAQLLFKQDVAIFAERFFICLAAHALWWCSSVERG